MTSDAALRPYSAFSLLPLASSRCSKITLAAGQYSQMEWQAEMELPGIVARRGALGYGLQDFALGSANPVI